MIIILIGYGLKKTAFLSTDAWQAIDKITYFILFPALLIHTLGNQTLDDISYLPILGVSVGTLLVSSVSLILFHYFKLTGNNATFTSIFQGGVRFNTYIILAISHSFFGSEGLTLASISIGFTVVMVNFLSISVFIIWGKNKPQGMLPYFKNMIQNPLILGCFIGWGLSLSGIGLPGVSENIFEIIGRAALPLGLLSVGSALTLKSIYGHSQAITLASIVQFGVKPLTATLLISSLNISGVTAGILTLLFIVPTAPSSYILARQLGGDMEAMASIITVQTLLAFILMPVLAYFLIG